ncbi:MAG: hypothetical protein IJV65_06050 [Kiritimatiellae bacterium]|nr:hypothetical protein [Kiritimatiellia bacterium]
MPSAARIFLAFRPLSRTLALALLALEGAWLAWAARAACLSPSPDYAVVVDMVRDMSAGERFPVFFYGQAYMGSLEPAASALLCAVFGFSPFLVALGSALVAWLACAAVAFFAKRAAGWTGAAFALLFAFPGPWYWNHFSVSPRGGYPLAVLLAVAGCGIAATSRLVSDPGGRPRPAPFAAFGLACGLALWNNLLAAPALAAGGLVLLGRLRAKAFSPRVWGPGAAAFLAGSAPWWIWNAANDWGGLDFSSTLPATGTYNAVRSILGPTLRTFVGADAAHPAAAALPAAFAALGALALAGALLRPRRAPALRLLAVAALHAFLLLLLWGKTPFGAKSPPRYLLPVAATTWLFCGAGLAGWTSGGARRRAVAAAAALVALAAGAVQFGASAGRFLEMRREGEALLAQVRAGTDGRPDYVYASYALDRLGWMSDREITLVCPLRCREPWRDAGMDRSDDVAVLQGYGYFEEFVSSTCGSVSRGAIGGTGAFVRPVPPEPAFEAAGAEEAPALDAAGRDRGGEVFDDDVSTAAALPPGPDGAGTLEIAFPEPRTLCGASIVFRAPEPPVAGAFAEAVDPDSGECVPLAGNGHPAGYYWSGPRPWHGGTAERLQLRWPPRSVSRLRLRFPARTGWPPPLVADIRLFAGPGAPAFDLAAVREALERLRAARGPLRLHADRWALARLDGRLDPALTTDPRSRRWPEALDAATRVDPAAPAVVAVPAGERESAARTLRRAGLAFEETAAGGAALFVLPGAAEAPPFFRDGGALRFCHGRLFLDAAGGGAAR